MVNGYRKARIIQGSANVEDFRIFNEIQYFSLNFPRLCSHFSSSLKLDQFSRDRRDQSFTRIRSDNKCPVGEIRLDGMRVVSAKGGVDYDDDSIPHFITKTKARLRLFGCGFTDQTVITFTKQANDRQGACLLPSSAQFEVIDEGLLEYTALVDIDIPVADPEPYYFCVKNAEDIQSEKVYQYQT